MSKFLMNEKYCDFLLLAELHTSSRSTAYAFKLENRIIYLEDIPDNYPSVTVLEVKSVDELKKVKKSLVDNGWEIIGGDLKEDED